MSCKSLSSIKIPNSVTNIGDYIFGDSKLRIATVTQEIELPDILRRAKREGDILYAEDKIQLANCQINEDNTKLIIDKDITSSPTLSIDGGAL